MIEISYSEIVLLYTIQTLTSVGLGTKIPCLDTMKIIISQISSRSNTVGAVVEMGSYYLLADSTKLYQ